MFKKISYSKVKIDAERSIRDAMILLNKINERFLIVLNEEKKLLGTVTDGDIRRAMLKNTDIDKQVIFCMNKKPIFTYENHKNKNSLFKKMKSTTRFLPIINKKKKILFILVDDKTEIEKAALILAGGFGTRLGKMTKNTPKPLLKIGKKPLLEIILQKLESAEYKNIYISTHYLHEKIKKFLIKRKSIANIKIIHESKALGTAGSISRIKDINLDFLTVINGDVISEINLNALNEFHLEKKFDLTLTVAEFSTKIPFGVVDLNNNFKFKSLKEKPIKKYFVLSGIYCLSKNICDLVSEGYIDMPELIDYAKKLGFKVGVFPIYEYWNDIGTPKSLIKEIKRIKN